jgi:hypothetical protein
MTIAAAEADSNQVVSIGVVAHITAASPGGPRYDSSLSSSQRRSEDNGIFVCQTCSHIIDSDLQPYSVTLLKELKEKHETWVRESLNRRSFSSTASETAQILQRVSGAGTSLYVVEIGRKFWLKFEGIPPMRNLAFELTDRTKWLELLSSLVPGSRADPFELFRPATVVTWHVNPSRPS